MTQRQPVVPHMPAPEFSAGVCDTDDLLEPWFIWRLVTFVIHMMPCWIREMTRWSRESDDDVLNWCLRGLVECVIRMTHLVRWHVQVVIQMTHLNHECDVLTSWFESDLLEFDLFKSWFRWVISITTRRVLWITTTRLAECWRQEINKSSESPIQQDVSITNSTHHLTSSPTQHIIICSTIPTSNLTNSTSHLNPFKAMNEKKLIHCLGKV